MSCCDCASNHCNAETQKPKILAVILDLDGTLLDTERATKSVFLEFLAKTRQTAIVEDYDLPLTPEQFIKEIIPMYQQKWKYMQRSLPIKVGGNGFQSSLGSDQVKAGKPSPDLFEEAARKMGVEAVHCLVIEDSMVGVKAANAAGMEVVAVPPHGEAAVCSSLANTVLHSLLEFQPEHWDLPPFQDWVDNALPIEPIYLSGLYVDGFVNEDTEDGKSALPDQVWGVFFGWAVMDMQKSYRVVVGIGSDHSSCSPQKKIQIHLVDGDNCCISNQQVKLLLVGHIQGLNRKEISSLDAERLEECESIASAALDLPIFSQHAYVPLYPDTFFLEDMVATDELGT
ncbi:hypothetical protein M0R45_031198 [Rubus argutus]|uniref:Riboflavin kinase n=1 Tax=Rubus argutus TaxID=59490 RepID=A0AAW1WFP6_RUBAR